MADRGFIEWEPGKDSRQLVDHILTVVNSYSESGLPAPTCRDVYYDLLGQYGSEHGYVKGEPFERKVYRLLRLMRCSRKIKFSDINDDSFDSLVLKTYSDPSDFWTEVQDDAKTYRKDLVPNQPKRIKVFTEGAGMVRQFYEVAKDYAVPVYSPGGWDSLTLKHQTARTAASEFERTGRQTVILHTGDLDPDGVALFENFQEDVEAFVSGYGYGYNPEEVIRFERAMIVPEQAYLLPQASRTRFSASEQKEENYRGQR